VKREKLSKFPLHTPFEKQEATTPLSEIGFRIVVNFYTDAPYIIGTATTLAGNLLITAKHVLTAITDAQLSRDGRTQINAHVAAVQVFPGPRYIIWDVVDGIADPVADLALLRLGTTPGRSDPDIPIVWRQPRINPFCPGLGEAIAAFGYKSSSIAVSKNAAGGNHIDLNDDAMISTGVVREIFEMRRDRLLPFPCYQVSARFAAGMSGGPVFDETGSLCGLVCSNIEGSHLDGEPVSYATTLWPAFRLILNFDRGDKYPRGVRYPAIDLARDGIVLVDDFSRLEKWFSENITHSDMQS
jgi:hypothetical protein